MYYWKDDLEPGETKGEGVGKVWFVAKPDYSIMLMDGYLIGKDIDERDLASFIVQIMVDKSSGILENKKIHAYETFRYKCDASKLALELNSLMSKQ